MLEVGIIDLLHLFFTKLPEALHVEGGQDRHLLLVAAELLFIAPLCRLLHRLETTSTMNASFNSPNSEPSDSLKLKSN
jgi:hypothetical protein